MFFKQLVLMALVCSIANGATKFASIEHQWLMDQAIAPLLPSSLNNDFVNANRITLGTFGTLVAMAGDFFGPKTIDQTVCFATTSQQAEQRWQDAFQDMWSTTDQNYVTDIQTNLLSERRAVESHLSQPSDALRTMPRYSWLSNGLLIPVLSRAFVNVDHFADGNCAWHTLLVGQRLTEQYAQRDDADVYTALAMTAFSTHMLSDLFSAGHMRCPRIALRKACRNETISSSATAQRMHDEDSANGLFVFTANHTTPFRAMGDLFALDYPDQTNVEQLTYAVQTLVERTLQTYQNKSTLLLTIEESLAPFIPRIAVNHSNTCPLFSDETGDVRVRAGPIYAYPCTTRAFVASHDCFGFGYGTSAMLEYAFLPPSIRYDAQAGAYVSDPAPWNREIPSLSSGFVTILSPILPVVSLCLVICASVWFV